MFFRCVFARMLKLLAIQLVILKSLTFASSRILISFLLSCHPLQISNEELGREINLAGYVDISTPEFPSKQYTAFGTVTLEFMTNAVTDRKTIEGFKLSYSKGQFFCTLWVYIAAIYVTYFISLQVSCMIEYCLFVCLIFLIFM